MDLAHLIPIIAIWLAFDAIVFLWAFLDNLYYSKNIRKTLRKIKENITEE